MTLRSVLDRVSSAGWSRDVLQASRTFLVRGDTSFAASLAFYTSLSFGPMVVLMLAVTGAMSPRLQTGFVSQASALLGPEAGKALDVVIKNASLQAQGSALQTAMSVFLIALSATAVFAQVQSTLNNIWEVQIKSGVRVLAWLRKRLLSFGMLLALGFLLGVSLALNALVSAALPGEGDFLGLLDAVISLVVFAALFALMYWMLPDAEVELRSVWRGALVAAVLLAVAKRVIGFYLARSTAASAYGTASAVVILLLWAFAASLIFFFGAELVRARTLRIQDELPEPESDLAKPADPADSATVSRPEAQA